MPISTVQKLLINVTDSTPTPITPTPSTPSIPTSPSLNAPNTGLAIITNPIVISLFAVIIVTAIIIFILNKTGRLPLTRSAKLKRISKLNRLNSRIAVSTLFGLLSLALFAAVASTIKTSHAEALALTLTLNTPQTIQIDKTSQTTNTTNIELAVNGFTGYDYNLTTKLDTNLPTGLTLSLNNDQDQSTSLSTTPTTIFSNQNTNDIKTKTLTATIDPTTLPAGNYEANLTYELIENQAPIPETETPFTSQDGSKGKVQRDKNLIPIKFTGTVTDPKWSKADSKNPNSDWFNYDEQKWANAVTVKPDKLTQYQNSTPGTIIPEEDVVGYFVYIPRYEYQVCRPNATDSITLTAGQCQDGKGNDVLSTAAPYLFNIKFQTKDQRTAYDGTTIGGWSTHPAFKFDTNNDGTIQADEELDGLWVAKFETTGSVSQPTVKPNLKSQVSQNVSTQFNIARNIGTDSANTHNLNQTNSRQMKNDDWGAVTYLSTSIYGLNDASKKVQNNAAYNSTLKDGNNNTGYGITGCGPQANNNDTQYNVTANCGGNEYQTDSGKLASTTHNVYGVYDMAGGATEYTMDNYNNTMSYSGFTTPPTANYMNTYLNPPFNGGETSNNNPCTFATCGGQALHETKAVQSVSSYNQSWGSDGSAFVYSGFPWSLRGGYSSFGSYSGLFACGSYYGIGDGHISVGFRSVLW